MDAVILALLGLGMVQLILLTFRFRESRWLRLGLFSCMFGASCWRVLRGVRGGSAPGLLDGFAMSLFGIATATEIVVILRRRRWRH